MSTSLNILPENDKIESILNRIDEIKKFLRVFKGYLNDQCQAYDGFGKTLHKTAKSIQAMLSPMSNDPNIIPRLSSRFIDFEDTSAKMYTQQFQDFNNVVNQICDDLNERMDTARRRIFDQSSSAIKNFGVAKTNYLKLKAKYEAACKEAESALSERKKAPLSAIQTYSLRNARKLDSRARSTLQNFLTSESQLKECIESANSRQFAMNSALQDSLNTFKPALHGRTTEVQPSDLHCQRYYSNSA